MRHVVLDPFVGGESPHVSEMLRGYRFLHGAGAGCRGLCTSRPCATNTGVDRRPGTGQTRLAGGNPPDSWQVHPCWELLGQYVDPGYVEPITELYQSEGWDKVMPKALVDSVTREGQTYSVLAGVHRGNELWFNKKLLAQHGITVGNAMSVDEFF